jgi:hypothetical protein
VNNIKMIRGQDEPPQDQPKCEPNPVHPIGWLSIKPLLIAAADVAGRCWIGAFGPVLVLLLFFTVYADIGKGTLEKSRFVVSFHHIIGTIPTTISGHFLRTLQRI